MTLSQTRNPDVKLTLFYFSQTFVQVVLSAWDEMKTGTRSSKVENNGSAGFQEVRKIEINRQEMEEDWDEDL